MMHGTINIKNLFCATTTFRNKNISKIIKLNLKNTKIDKTLTCASETWLLSKRDGKQINIFERKVYRRNLGLMYVNEKEKLENVNK